MKATVSNTIFATVACWPDWLEKTRIVRLSAKKQGVDLIAAMPGEPWMNYYTNKIVLLDEWLIQYRNKNKKKKYFCYVDGRDVVFVKNVKTLVKSFSGFDEDKIYFNNNLPAPWPVRARWFQDRIRLRYGYDGTANSGVYVGKIDTVLEMFERCKKLNSFFLSDEQRPGTMEGIVKQALSDIETGRRTTPFQIPSNGINKHLDSDQFYVQLLQSQWDDTVRVDTERKAFAGFDGGWPSIAEWKSNGTMPLGTAGILHSPYMFPRTKFDETKDDWESWAVRERLI